MKSVQHVFFDSRVEGKRFYSHFGGGLNDAIRNARHHADYNSIPLHHVKMRKETDTGHGWTCGPWEYPFRDSATAEFYALYPAMKAMAEELAAKQMRAAEGKREYDSWLARLRNERKWADMITFGIDYGLLGDRTAVYWPSRNWGKRIYGEKLVDNLTQAKAAEFRTFITAPLWDEWRKRIDQHFSDLPLYGSSHLDFTPIDTADAWLVKNNGNSWRKINSSLKWGECPRVDFFDPFAVSRHVPSKAWWECLPAFADGVAAYRRFEVEQETMRRQEERFRRLQRERWEAQCREDDKYDEHVRAKAAAREQKRRNICDGIFLWTGVAICLIVLALA